MMTKKILVTAGPVYGRIDSNKIISNRARGIWALRLSRWLAEEHGFEVHQVVADTMKDSKHLTMFADFESGGRIKTLVHQGYFDYVEICRQEAEMVDVAIMAAAVLNYIPETTYEGKLPTDKDRIGLHFMLAPKVINHMKERNPNLTLIGCKLLFSGNEETLVTAAYKVVLDAKCNMVIANDGEIGLRKKFLVHQDRTVIPIDDDYDRLYDHILNHINDQHWRTSMHREDRGRILKYGNIFDGIVEKYQDRFIPRQPGSKMVFGAVATRYKDPGVEDTEEWLVSPREKAGDFDRWDAVVCSMNKESRQMITWGKKATLNAPLLIRHLKTFPRAVAVLHYHGNLIDGPTYGSGPWLLEEISRTDATFEANRDYYGDGP